MKNKTIFLDRDGTINLNKNGYVHKIEDLEFIPQSLDGLKKLQGVGYSLIIITNQSGIGKGYYTERDYFNFRAEFHKRLMKEGVFLTAEYFCPHNPDDKCSCRKPETGMLEQAAYDFILDLNNCWMIGDKDSDILAGKKAGCKTIHVLTGESKKVYDADFTAKNLVEAADYILENDNK